jgi:hypothetical protein
MAGLVPAIHAAPRRNGRRMARDRVCVQLASVVALDDVDGRDKPGHDGVGEEIAA